MFPETMRPYLAWSLGAHLALGALFGAVISGVSLKKEPVYQIDFVGPTRVLHAGAAAREPEAAKTAAAPAPNAPAPSEEIVPGKSRPLPRPSLTSSSSAAEAPTSKAAAEAPASAGEAPAGPAGVGAPGQEGIFTDLPNFPYPWYISQVRAGLWAQWSARMPSSSGECVIVFSILRNGSVVDLRVEESSGDSGVDLAALSAAQDAAPFPPLPRGFEEAFLKIHVTLKTR